MPAENAEAWHTDRWFTSPWNHDPDVVERLRLPDRIEIHDVTLGIIATWVRNVRDTDPTESFPFLPGLVGQADARLVLGKGSGVDSVAEWLEQIGAGASDDERLEILGRVKQASLHKRGLLDREEFERIVGDVVPGAPARSG